MLPNGITKRKKIKERFNNLIKGNNFVTNSCGNSAIIINLIEKIKNQKIS